MIKQIKSLLYFPIAYYFKFFAQIQLAIWKPKIIVVTGSSGKTTLLHLIESQIQDKARYSHLANSSYGIPFDILGLHRKDLTIGEWPSLFLAAPFKAFKNPPKEKLYVVEADCDRPYEGKFLASLLNPEVTLWTGVGKTHTMNFDSLVLNRHSGKPRQLAGRIQNLSCHGVAAARDSGQARLAEASAKRARMTDVQFSSVEDAIAYEFGYFLEATSKLSIVNADSQFIKEQIPRSKAIIKRITQSPYSSSDQAKPESREALLKDSSRQARTINPEIAPNYKIFKNHTQFKINGKIYSINALLPKETSYLIQMTLAFLEFLNIKPDFSFSKFKLPPSRCSKFSGIKNITIIDSSYNATPDGVKSILGMFDQYPSDKKWLVLGDMIELGNEEQEEHEKLATIINSMMLDTVILVGPRVSKYTYPKLTETVISTTERRRDPTDNIDSNGISRYARNDKIKKFTMPKDALDYLVNNLKGREVILFKGARFLEGIIEHLLADKNDVKKLCRREKVWQERRKKWGL